MFILKLMTEKPNYEENQLVIAKKKEEKCFDTEIRHLSRF